MLFFKILAITGALLASSLDTFKIQVVFNTIFTLSVLIILLVHQYYMFAFIFLVIEILYNKMITLSNNNSFNKNIPSFKIFKKDKKKIVTIISIGLIYIQTYTLAQGNIKTQKLLYEYEVFLKSIPLIIMTLFILTLSRWSKND